MIRRAHWLLLAAIVLATGAMRFADLGGRPNGLFRDEAEKGYNAWSIATTGGALEFTADPQHPIVWRALPWMIDVMSVRTSAIYQYASVPFMWVGGLTVATTRMAAALAGTLTVLLIGLVFMRAWGAGAGLAAALWTALCPWHLVFSRWALQGAFVPLLIVLVLAGLYGVERARRWGWPLAGAAMGWLFYSYSGAQPLVLAWGGLLLVIYRRELRRGGVPLIAGVILFLVPVVPTLFVLLGPGGSTRWSTVSVFNQPGATKLSASIVFVRNYLSHFSPAFLFWDGDPNPRHCIPGAGQLTPLDIVLLPLGAIWTIRTRRPLAWALAALFVCGPLPSAPTTGLMPHGLRSFAMVVPAVVWGGAGLWLAAEWAGRRSGGRRLSYLVWTAGLAVGLSLFALYWKAYDADPRVQVAFEKGEADSWTRIIERHRPGQRVLISAQIPYAPYYQLFFMKVNPHEAAAHGLERGGTFYYLEFNPNTQGELLRKMQPGDWILTPYMPWEVLGPDRQPLLSREEAMLLGENWIMCWQKPAAGAGP